MVRVVTDDAGAMDEWLKVATTWREDLEPEVAMATGGLTGWAWQNGTM